VLETFEFDIFFYYRYVDDIVLTVLTSKIDLVFNKFNSIHPRLKFTIEIGKTFPLIFWTILSFSKIKKFCLIGFTNRRSLEGISIICLSTPSHRRRARSA